MAALLAVTGAVLVGLIAMSGPVGGPEAVSTWRVVTRSAAIVPVWRVETIRRGPGYAGVARWTVPVIEPAQTVSIRARSVRSMPQHGAVGSVVIPASRSHFRARPALVYLPPAALTRRPARVPVVVAFSGQSRGAGPIDLVRQANLAAMMDRIARLHGGVAPIVVVPDQLGPGSPNPMCVDSKLGRVRTYVTVDVRNWIMQHLPVEAGRRFWTVAGFSEGGTCAIQFAAGEPRVFGSFVDVSGELAPRNGSLAHTIDVGFAGSRARYRAATPSRLLVAHRPFTATHGYFAVGALDRHYGPVEPVLRRRATAAGIVAAFWRIPHVGHDWVVGAAGLAWGFTRLATWWRLPVAPAGQR